MLAEKNIFLEFLQPFLETAQMRIGWKTVLSTVLVRNILDDRVGVIPVIMGTFGGLSLLV